jgi:parallel beta-helix repeat protein
MRYCLADHSTGNGLYMESYSDLTLEKSVIRYSGENGLKLNRNSSTLIKNCWIHNNGGAGIYFDYPVEDPLLRNNTIYDNHTYGIQLSAALTVDPNICNCIISDNDSNDLYRENGTFNKINYCLLQHPHTGTGNKTGDPGFMNVATNPNDLHLAENSQCKNAGNPYANYTGETDIDGEDRVKYGRVDIGADEYYISLADFYGDGIVNFLDFALFADAWQTQNPDRSLDGNSYVNMYDLKLFCEDWLWKAPWDDGWMMSMGSDGGDLGESLAVESFEVAESSRCLTAEIKTKSTDSLMITDAAISMAKRPTRLAAKSDIFYSIKPRRLPPDQPYRLSRKTDVEKTLNEKSEIEAILKWLDNIWLNGKLKEAMTEADYLEFRKAIEESVQ